MTIFRNKESGNHFAVDNVHGAILMLRQNQLRTLEQFAHIFGGLDILTIPDLDTVKLFRKLVQTGILADVSYSDTTTVLVQHYPEYFI